jgi:hypothetical protein
MIQDRAHRWFPLPSRGWLLFVPVMLCGAVGCIDFDRELSNLCERNRDTALCGGQPPEIVSTRQNLQAPDGTIFGFDIEAHDPQDRALHFTWEVSSTGLRPPAQRRERFPSSR